MHTTATSPARIVQRTAAAVATLCALSTLAAAQAVAPAPAAPAPAPAKSPDLGHAAGTPEAKPAAPTAQQLVGQWTTAEIEAAQKSCMILLKGLDLVAVGAAPVRDGDCGTPAPIELSSVGKVALNPPVIVTCEMAAAMHKWVTGDLQGLAKKNLGGPLVRIDTMSSYSCRNAYGRTKSRLSEHGRANAIDIRSFHTAKNDTVDVLAHWGPTERDVAAQIAAAKAADEKQRALAGKQPQTPGAPTVPGTNPVATGSAPAVAEGSKPGVVIGIPGAPGTGFPASTPSAIGLSNGMSPPNRLGGPKPATPPEAAATLRGAAVDQTDGRMTFLKAAHASACRIFGTVLGPEANNAHRNHFHVDMAKRERSSFCE